jgi:hypothetical protein
VHGEEDIRLIDDTSAGHRYLANIGANFSPVGSKPLDGHRSQLLGEGNSRAVSENVDIESSVNTTPSHSEAMEDLISTQCFAILALNRHKVFGALLDTASSHSIMFEDTMDRLGLNHLFVPKHRGRTLEIRGLSGSVRVIGSLKLKFFCQGRKIKTDFKVVPSNGQTDAILGTFVVLKHELLPSISSQ